MVRMFLFRCGYDDEEDKRRRMRWICDVFDTRVFLKEPLRWKAWTESLSEPLANDLASQCVRTYYWLLEVC